MSYSAGVVLGKPGVQIFGYTGVEMLPSEALKDVDIFHGFAFASTYARASARHVRLRQGFRLRSGFRLRLSELKAPERIWSAYARATARQPSPLAKVGGGGGSRTRHRH